MQESEEETLRREEMIRMYRSTKEALQIVSDIDSHTNSTPLPPPITSDDMDYRGQPNPSPKPSRRPMSTPTSRPAAPARPAPSRPDAPSVTQVIFLIFNQTMKRSYFSELVAKYARILGELE